MKGVASFKSKQPSAREIFKPSRYTARELFPPPPSARALFVSRRAPTARQLFTSPTATAVPSARQLFGTSTAAPTAKEIFAAPPTTAKEIFAPPTTVEKTTIDKVIEIASDRNKTSTARVKAIIRETLGEKPTTSTYRALTNWIWSSWRSVSWGLAISAAVAVGVVVGTVFLGGGSWLALLAALKYAGINIIPGMIAKSLVGIVGKKAVGMTVDTALSLAKRNRRVRRVLEKKIPTSYAKPVLTRLGVDVNNITAESITKGLFNQGVNIATSATFTYGLGAVTSLSSGLWTDLLMSNGLSIGAGIAKEAVTGTARATATAAKQTVNAASSLVREADRIRQRTADIVLNGPTKTDTVVGDIVTDIEENVPRPARKIRRATVNRPRNKTEVTSTTASVIAENKTAAVAGTAALSLIALALTGNADKLVTVMSSALSAAPEVAAKLSGMATILNNIPGASMIAESKMAQTFVMRSLLDKVGVNKLIDIFTEYLTPEQKKKAVSLSQRLREEKDAGKISQISSSLLLLFTTGGTKYYSATDLSKLKIVELKAIFKSHFPKSRLPRTKKDLIRNILKAQDTKVGNLSSLMGGILNETLKSAAASMAVAGIKTGVTSIQEMKNKIAEAEAQLAEPEVIEPEVVEPEVTEPEVIEPKPVKPELVMKGAKGEILTPEDLAKQAQELKERTRKALREAARAKVAEMKQAKVELSKLKAERHKAAIERAKIRMATKEAKVAALNDQQLRDMETVIVKEDGTAVPIASEEVLIPEQIRDVLEKMGEFTPLMQMATKEAMKATTNWIPGIGWINSGLQTAKVGLKTADLVKNIGMVGELLTSIDEDGNISEESLENIAMLERMGKVTGLGQYIPTLGDAIDNIVKEDKTKWISVYKRAVIDATLEGWDTKRTMFEVGKQVLGNPKDLNIDVVETVGQEMWNKLFG